MCYMEVVAIDAGSVRTRTLCGGGFGPERPQEDGLEGWRAGWVLF